MTKNADVDLTEDRLFPLGWGFIFRVVCAPSSWSPEKVSEELTKSDPPGTSANRWVVSEPDDERDGDFKGCNHIQCNDDKNRTHWLMNC